MKFDPAQHHRRNIRLKGYDYSNPGFYFITVCALNRTCLFGSIDNGKMILNDAGKMILKRIHELPQKFAHIRCDIFIIIPNHVYAIVTISPAGADQRVM